MLIAGLIPHARLLVLRTHGSPLGRAFQVGVFEDELLREEIGDAANGA